MIKKILSQLSFYRLSKLLFNGILIISLAFLSAEILWRALFIQSASSQKGGAIALQMYTPSANQILLYKLKPNTQVINYGADHRINGLGFRGESLDKKKIGVKRIAMLGDSIIYGYNLEQSKTIPARLQQSFLGAGHPLEVLNLGVPGYEAEQTVEFFEEVGLPLKPDIVIYGYNLNDSIYAAGAVEAFQEGAEAKITFSRNEPEKTFLRLLFERSALFARYDKTFELQRRFKQLRTYREQSIWHFLEDKHRRVQDPPFSEYQKLKIPILAEAKKLGTDPEILKTMFGVLGIENDDFYSSHWNLSKKALMKLQRLSQKHDFQVVFVIFPFLNELERYPLIPMHDFLKKEAASLGFHVIDLLDFAKQMKKNHGREFHFDDTHLTAFGIELASDYLRDTLISLPALDLNSSAQN